MKFPFLEPDERQSSVAMFWNKARPSCTLPMMMTMECGSFYAIRNTRKVTGGLWVLTVFIAWIIR